MGGRFTCVGYHNKHNDSMKFRFKYVTFLIFYFFFLLSQCVVCVFWDLGTAFLGVWIRTPIFAKSSVEIMMTVIVVGEVLVNNGAEHVGVRRKLYLSAFVFEKMFPECSFRKSHGLEAAITCYEIYRFLMVFDQGWDGLYKVSENPRIQTWWLQITIKI